MPESIGLQIWRFGIAVLEETGPLRLDKVRLNRGAESRVCLPACLPANLWHAKTTSAVLRPQFEELVLDKGHEAHLSTDNITSGLQDVLRGSRCAWN